MGMNLAERILARSAGRDQVAAGEFVMAEIDLALLHDIFAAQATSASSTSLPANTFWWMSW